MARETAEERREAQVGQGSGSAPKRSRRQVVAPPLVFFADLNERHAYLNFDDMPQPHKNNALNKLYKLRTHKVCPPKFLAQFYINYFGLDGDFKEWFSLGMRVGNRVVNCGIWDNVFLNREPVYRELCLEFYSTLRLTKELHKIKDIFEERVVIFMCGGVQRKASVAEFGAMVGMYTNQDLSNPDYRNMLRQGYYPKQDLGDGESIMEYWTRISGGEVWTTGGYVSVNKINSVRLRLLHRILVNSFIQRSSHWDKAYLLDLWLLKLFTEGSPRKFALAPMVLLDRMCNHSASSLVLGHFVTRIYRYMGIFDSEACQTYLSHPVYQVELDRKELIRIKIIKKKEGDRPDRLMDDEGEIGSPPSEAEDDDDDDEDMEDAPQPQPQPRRRGAASIDLTPLSEQLQQIFDSQQASNRAFDGYQRRMDEEVSWLGSQQSRTNYTLDYYQPMWDSQYHGRPFIPDSPPPEFRPPPIYVPAHRQDGGSYFFTPDQMMPRPHDLGGSPRGPVQFGRFTGGGAGVSSSMPSFPAGTASGFADIAGGLGGFVGGSSSFGAGFSGGDAGASGSGHAGDQGAFGYGGSGSGQEEATDWLMNGIFGSSPYPPGYGGQF